MAIRKIEVQPHFLGDGIYDVAVENPSKGGKQCYPYEILLLVRLEDDKLIVLDGDEVNPDGDKHFNRGDEAVLETLHPGLVNEIIDTINNGLKKGN